MLFVLVSCHAGGSFVDTLVGTNPNLVKNGGIGNDALQFSPNPLDFGNVGVGRPAATGSITVTNGAKVPIKLKTIGTPSEAGLTIASDSCSVGTEMQVGEACSLTMQYLPLAGADLSDVIKFEFTSSTDTNTVYANSAKIIGTAIAPLNFAGLLPIVSSEVSTTHATLRWNAVAGVSSYLIYDTTSGTPVQIATAQASATSLTITTLSANTHYTFRAHALNVLGDPDANTVDQPATTDATGAFATMSPLAAAEGATSATSALDSLCSDARGHSPQLMTIDSQSDSDLQCSMLTSPYRVQCTPNYKTGLGSWSGTVVVNCLLDDYPIPYSQTLTVNVAKTFRPLVMQAISGQNVTGGTAIAPVQANATSPDGDSITYACQYDNLVDGSVSGSAAACATLINKNGTNATFTAGGLFNWTPRLVDGGKSFEVKVTATGVASGLTASKIFVINVGYPPPSAAQSLLTISASTVVSGASVIITLDSKDSDGNDLPVGGATVTFNNAGGTSSGIIGAVTDNHDGSYSAPFTGTVAGTATSITATIQGSNVTTPQPTVIVTPGAISAVKSLITVGSDTVISGNATTLTLQAKDAAGNLVTTGGAAVVFARTAGTSTGTISSTTDNHDGTYTATFTGVLAGTATSISATVNGVAVSTILPGITVLPGIVSVATSVVAVTGSVASVASGSGVQVWLSAKDAAGNSITSGGLTVAFSFTGGVSAGTFGTVLDNSNGTYSAVLTGTAAGSASVVSATIGGVSVMSPLPSLTVTPGPASTLTSTVASGTSNLASGASTALTVQTKDAFGNLIHVGGSSITFASGGGTSTGTIGAVTDNHDGTYTSSFTGGVAGTATTISAMIGGSSITTQLPVITVTAGPIAATGSILTVTSPTTPSGAAVTARLQAKDAAGNSLSTGGAIVLMSASGGTSTGTLSSVSDNGDGSYTATFTGVLVGTATTLHATINGVAITTPLPTVIVTPGALAAANALVTASSSTVASGSSVTILLQARDTAGNNIPTGGATVVFTANGGTSSGNFIATIDNGNGTYTTTFTGVLAGTATTINAVVNNTSVTTALPTIAVLPGPVSVTTSQVTTSASSVQSGNTVTFTLQAKDAAGNALTSGGSAVLFSTSGGTSTGSLTATADGQNGIYTSTFTGALAGTASTIHATIAGTPVTSSLPTISVLPGAVSVANSLITVSSSTVMSGSSVTVQLQARDAAGNNLSLGGAAVAFSRTGGTSTGTFGSITDNNNGTYTSTFSGVLAGTATAMAATVNGVTVTTPLPLVQVTPGVISAATSLMTVSNPSVASGSSVTLTLQAKDAAGNLIVTGGASVAFSASAGSAPNPSTGTISAATDNGNGTYTSTFVGVTAGTATTISSTIGGGAVTTTHPTIIVLPGSASPATSILSVASGGVISGATTTISLQTKDAAGNTLTSGGAVVVFAANGGTSTGTINAVVDNSDGSYAATFKGVLAGTPTTISATIAGVTITTPKPTITVTPGAISVTNSLISVSMPTVLSGNSVTATLQARDAAGNALTASGGATVVFSRSGGTSTGNFGTVTDNNNGTYTSSFTGVIAGTATSIGATVNGSAVTTSLPTVTVTPGLISPASSIVTVSNPTVASGANVILTMQAKDAAGNAISTGGSSVTFTANGGTSTGTIGATADAGNGLYTASFTGVLSGTATSIGASIGGATVTTTPASLQVIPGAASAGTSILTANLSTIPSGTATSITLQAKDAAGNNLVSGGSAVTFSVAGGSSTGSLSTPIDNGNGSYTTTFTGVLSGSATTISAVIGGAPLTTPKPTITVTPGSLSLAQSAVSLAAASVASGSTVLVTLQAKDAAGNNILSGGSTVTFTRTGGTSTGSFGAVTDNGNGTYSANFLGVVAGTATTIGATVGGASVSSTLPSLTVLPGSISTSQSVITVASATVTSGGSDTLTLTAKDAAGNTLTSGGSAVVFSSSGGTSTGTLSTSTDQGNGHYTASFTGVLAGTPTSISATIGGTAISTTLPTVTVNPGLASGSTSTLTVASSSVASGVVTTVSLTARDAAGNSLSSGGAAVAFSSSGGTSTGILSAASDLSNGTYTGTFTGVHAGTATSISATVNGTAVATTLPTVTVTPGAVSPDNSLITVAASTVSSGSSVNATLQSRDAAGNIVTSSGATVVFSRTGGTSTGTFGAVTDNGNGTYTSAFTGVAAGTATMIRATVNGTLVATTAPTVIVTPGNVSTSTSLITVSSATVMSGANITLMLTARDAANNLLTTGGSTIAFSVGGGTSTGTLSSVNDNGNGTYSAIFTGVSAGTPATVNATIAGVAVSSTLPTVQVTPGVISNANSLVTASNSSVASGTSITLTLQAKDAVGNNLIAGGASVAFSASGGTSTGTITSATDNGNGTYTATFTGVFAGTATSIAATIGGAAVSTTEPAVTVTPGSFSLSRSTIAVGSSSIASGTSTSVTLTSRDSAGNSILTGGLTIVFTRAGGSSTGTFGFVSDNGNGTYSAAFTGVVAGSASSIGATAGGAAITSTLPTVTVLPGAVSVDTSLVSVSSATVNSGSAITLNLSAKDAAGNALTTGGSAIVFSRSGGTSTGAISATTDQSNGVYTASFTGLISGSATTISATIGGTAVTTTLPTVTVNPGPASGANSTIAVAATTIGSGNTVAVTLTARDAAGNSLSAGGATVLFALSGGTSTGSISSATDNGNGTYSSTFTGILAGSATTISATVNGTAVATTLPTIAVTPGVAAPANALITVASPTVASGASLAISLQARDAAGNFVTTGGSTIVFSRSGGSSTGTFGAVTDNVNGIYSVAFTGAIAGTPTSIHATFDGTTVTTTAPTVTVTPGVISPAASLLTVSSSTVVSGSDATLTLQAKDAAGNLISVGGATVSFGNHGGASTGTIGTVADGGNGIYTAPFTGVNAGTATSISATINGVAVTTSQPTLQVLPGAASANTSTLVTSLTALPSGTSATLTLTARDAAGNSLVAGGATVVFSSSGGTSTGTLTSAIDNGNGTYTGTFTGSIAGSATTISATVNGAPIATTQPTITVTPGALSLAQSSVTLAAGSVASGSSVVATLQARDSAGNNILSGGATVAFTRSGGTSTGTFGAVADNGNGTYSASFTGVTAGTATTIGATVGGASVTSTLPTLTVIPGSISATQSVVLVATPTVSSGATVVVTLTAKDAAGNSLTSGGSAIAFALSGGTSTGSFAATVDHSNGVYTSSFTGLAAGTAASITAAIAGVAVATPSPTITVNPGAPSAASSLITVGSTTLQSGTATTLTLTAKDAAGNSLTIGGATVAFSSGGGTSTGTIASVVDHSNGVYTATFTGATAGTATTINATINGSSVATTAPTITVTPGLISPAQSLITVSSATVNSGAAVTLTLTAKDAAGNALTAGGASVAFSNAGGTSTGTVSGTNDGANGTYTATFTGVVAGTATSINATIGGTAVTSTSPTVKVNPGIISTTQSVLTASNSTVVSGSVITLTLTAKDSAGNSLTSGGATVTFGYSGGSSTGTVGLVNDSANGTYTASFTGVLSGAATSITATIGGAAVTTSSPHVTVTPGGASPTTSLLFVTNTNILSGATSGVTLQAKDAAGNTISSGGANIAFSASGGGSTGTFTTAVDNADGTYSSTFTGVLAGSATSIGATIAGVAVSTTLPTIKVNPGAVSLAQSYVSVTGSPSFIKSGYAATAVLTSRDNAGNNLVSGGLAVTFSYSGGTSTGVFSAVTDNGNGTYSVSLTGQASGTSSQITGLLSGTALTSTKPNLIVVPGDVSLSNSTVAVGSATVNSGGQTSITIATKDAYGNSITSGIAAVLATSGGTSTGSIATIVDNGNGTQSSVFTGLSTGSATTITATLNGSAITSTLPTISVNPGSISSATSTLAVSSATALSGDSISLTVTGRDANGNLQIAGGASVVFSASGGTSTGTVSSTTDNGNGTYSAVFLARAAGTATTIRATINGTTLSTTLPTITVSPGAISPATSPITISSATLLSGSSMTVTLTSKDAYGNAITAGGATVAFSRAGGTSTGSFGVVTDNGDGTYTSIFTGVTSGTATTIAGTINGANVTSTAPTVTVTPGAINLANSLVTVSSGTISAGSTSTITLTAKDTAGNFLTTGGRTVAFGRSGGSSSGTFSAVNDNANGTYTATFTGTTSGTPTFLTAMVDGSAITSTLPSITVNVGPYSLAQSTVAVSATSVAAGSTSTFTLTVRDAYGNSQIAGGLTTTFTLSGGTSAGTLTSVVDNNNGTYTATFTGTAAGSALNVSATIGGSALTSSAQQVIVVPGAINLARSLASVGNASVVSGASTALQLVAKDAYGNLLTSGGRTVQFTYSGGVSTGTISSTTDSGTGTYSATFTGVTAGSATTINVTVDGSAVTSTLPTITVTPGNINLASSLVTVSSATIAAGATSLVTLQAKDAAGNNLTTGGSPVLFSKAGGSSSGTFSSVTDNGNGTYSATFTGTTSGTATTIGATISGSAVTSTLPLIQVNPGPYSLAQSLITLSSAAIASGTSSVVTLQAKDAYGNNLTTGNLTVAFTRSGGSSAGVFSTVVDNSNGTYTSSFTGTTSGTPTTIGGTIGGSAITSTLPTLTVTPGAVSLSQSIVSVATPTITSGSSTTLTLTAKDANGNNLTTGGLTVSFTRVGGGSSGTIAAAVDNANGTYTATFTGTTSGTATTINATIGGSSVTSTLPTLTVNPGTISLSQSLVSVSSNSVTSGSAVTLTLQARDAAGNSLTTGGSVVAFTRSGGTSTGSISSTTDSGSGTYTATFTGVLAGTATTINATIGGSNVTSGLPAITVSPGAYSLATSLTTLSGTTVASGANVTVTLQAKDAAGNSLTTGGLAVSYSRSGGVSNGTFGAVTDNNNGSYTAIFTATAAGSATSIIAAIGGSAVTSTAPSLTVTAGAMSLALSTVTVSSAAVTSGTNVTLTLTSRDAYGNLLTTGGLTVGFTRAGGNSNGSISATTDNGNGTYSAIFTATTSGSATTITGTIGGANLTSTAPTITVSPGVISVSQSVVSVSTGTVASSNTVNLTLTAKDAAGNLITSGGSTVVFGRTGGTSTGTFSAVTDNSNGTYSAVFTGVTAGTATTITSTIGGASVTSTLPTILVVPGTVSTSQSLITVSAATITSGGASTITLRAIDANNNYLKAGGLTVAFSRSGGTSSGTFSAVQDNGDGSYTSIFTGTTSGTATTINGTINSSTVTSTLPTITVQPGSSTTANSVITVSSAIATAGQTVTLSLQAKDASGNNSTAGGLTVVFTRAGGGSNGTISATTDNGNGTYSATFLATTSGTATTIGATIGGANVTSTQPTITVSPGAVSLSQSLTTLSTNSIQAGGTSTVTFQAKDAYANNLTTGGLTITFAKSGGTSSGTFSTAVDNNNGTYTSTFTGTTSGSQTSIVASSSGTAVTSTAPTLTVTPGSFSVSQSTLTSSATTAAAGTPVTLTVTSRDAYGNAITTGGLAVTFSRTGGTSSGTFGSVTDNNNGTYSTTFTGTVSGTATTMTASINGTPISSALPSVTVTPGAYSLSQSIVSVQSASLSSGSTEVITLTVKDTYGNQLTTNGLTVVFSRTGGTSSGTISSTTDNNNGTYAANFLGTTAGTATTITATIGGATVTSTSPTITVTPGAVSLAQSLVSITGSPSVIASGANATVVLTSKDSAGNLISTGGLTVAFTATNGTSSGSFSTVVDNGNGTYSSTFTGAASGTALSFSATIGGATVTSTKPTMAVVPGAYSLSTSTVTLAASTVNSGSAVVATMTARDTYGNQLTSGGLAPTFFASGGTSTVTIGSVTDGSNGTYTVSLTGVVSGTPTSIGAKISSASLTSTFPTLLVNPGTISVSQSTISVSSSGVLSGSSVTLTLTAKDANGNKLTSGSQAIVFSRSGGTSTGNISGTTDANNGTYTATFVGVTSGTATTINATINGTTVTSGSPTITVSPGAISTVTSVVTLSSSTVASGSTIVSKLQAKDAAGNNLTTGGSTIQISLSSTNTGLSTGTFISVIDNSDGTYTSNFTGVKVGSANTLAATIGGTTVTSTMPAVTVSAGPASLATSVVTASATQVVSGGSLTLTLQAKDANSNTITVGGLSVGFNYSGGTSTGSMSATLDNNNGTYTSTFTGANSGTATTIGATIGGGTVTSTPMPQVTVLPLPVLTTITNQLNSTNNPLAVGANYSFDINNTLTNDDSGMTYSCYYDRILDSSVTATNLCTTMPGTPTFSTTNGQFAWTIPTTGAGPYELKIQGCTTAGCATEYIQLNVKQPYTTTNLVTDLDAEFAAGLNSIGNNSPLTTTWKNLVVSSPVKDSVLTVDMQSGSPWVGDGTRNGSGASSSAGPYRIVMNGSSNYLDLSTTYSAFPGDLAISTWVRPVNVATSTSNSTTIFSNGGAAINTTGIELLQSSATAGTLELAIAGHQSYETVRPTGTLLHYRLDETTLTNGATINDDSGNANSGVVRGTTYTTVSPGALPGDTDAGITNTATSSTGNGVVSSTAFPMTGFQQFSYEIWFKVASGYAKGGYLFAIGNNASAGNGDSNHDRKLWLDNSGNIVFGIYTGVISTSTTSGTVYNDGKWHHVVSTYDYSATNGTIKIYVDGSLKVTTTNAGVAQTGYNGYVKVGSGTIWSPGPSVADLEGSIDEAAVYSRVLTASEVTARANANKCRSTAVLANNTFYNVGVTYNSTTLVGTMYINGVQQCQTTYAAGSSVVSSYPFTVGARPGASSTYSNYWAGAVGNFRIYSSSATNTQTVYSNTSGIFP